MHCVDIASSYQHHSKHPQRLGPRREGRATAPKRGNKRKLTRVRRREKSGHQKDDEEEGHVGLGRNAECISSPSGYSWMLEVAEGQAIGRSSCENAHLLPFIYFLCSPDLFISLLEIFSGAILMPQAETAFPGTTDFLKCTCEESFALQPQLCSRLSFILAYYVHYYSNLLPAPKGLLLMIHSLSS